LPSCISCGTIYWNFDVKLDEEMLSKKFWLKMSLACFEISARETQEKLHDRPRNDKRILRAGVDELIKRERLKQEEKRRI
jgi:hypothetical protein